MSLLSSYFNYKQAEVPLSAKMDWNAKDFRTALQKELEQKTNMRLLGNVGKVGLGGLGVGAILGGLNSLRKFSLQPALTESPVQVSEDDEELPYPVLPRRRIKKASFWGDMKDNVWYGPAMITAGAGTAMGGMALTNWLADKRMKSLQEDDLEEEKKKYEKSMIDQYPRSVLKRSPYTKIASQILDSLYDSWEKRSEGGLLGALQTAYTGATEAISGLPSIYATYAVPTALLAGLYGYNRYSNSNERIMQSALKRRQAMRSLEQPQDVFMEPRPMPIQDLDNTSLIKKRKKDEDDED